MFIAKGSQMSEALSVFAPKQLVVYIPAMLMKLSLALFSSTPHKNEVK